MAGLAAFFALPEGAAVGLWLARLLQFIGLFVAYLIVGGDILRKAWRGLCNRRLFDENFLMAVATLGAIALAIYQRSGDINEAVAVMLFYQLGELFQSVAIGRSRKNIAELMDIRPDTARLEREGELVVVDPDEVPVGSTIVVQPGEKVPIDGRVIEGRSTLNTAALTGESLPREVGAGDEIISGCINLSAVLRIKTTKPFGESTVSKILELVENASSRKAKSEEFISKFARVYTPVVTFSALALAFLPPLIRWIFMGLDPLWGNWIYRALIFLVISCPCALVTSIPLSFFAGLGGASREGILIKGANYLETLAKTGTVVFDKTGTLTRGSFEVQGLHHSSYSQEKILELAAHAEYASSHPISRSLREAWGHEPERSRVRDFKEYHGEGVTAVVDDTEVAAGNEKLMQRLGLDFIPCRQVGTIVHIAINGAYAGHILISDVIKEESAAAVQELRQAGVHEIVMLTGDDARVAGEVGQKLGIDRVESELLPGDKVAKLEELLAVRPAKSGLAFVGDGINDAPVLRLADVGIAMGALGSDAAIEAADVVLMDDNPRNVAKAIRIARKCLRIARENIVFALGVKLLCLLLGALGLANMWTAIFADVGVMVLAVLNAIRALFVKRL
ncbi:MAG: heavy metal translocating P-type ATPase [Clostridiales bacterium]|nr:heavy metal translocating P-type ATPase [Clostridiales bacterium]MDY3060958.1 heavy metal translocating P-type ATPase [Eubacteriales bacterium]